MNVTTMSQQGFRIILFSMFMGMVNAQPEDQRKRTAREILQLLRQAHQTHGPIPVEAKHELDWATEFLDKLA